MIFSYILIVSFFSEELLQFLQLKSLAPRVLSLGLTVCSNPAALQNAKQLPFTVRISTESFTSEKNETFETQKGCIS